MSVEQFCFRLRKSHTHPNRKKWMPHWLEEYKGAWFRAGGRVAR